ncbi:MAG: Gfo/Idh/MocA family oxidoreductase [Planctomycetota bacterium]
MSKQSHRAALIGCGKVGTGEGAGKTQGGFRIGYTHGDMYRNHESVNLVGAADIDARNLAAFQKEFNVDAGYIDYVRMLAEVKPDILSICTYVGLHRPMIEEAVRAGVRGILCEKPFVQSPADLKAVCELADRTGIKICIAHQRTNHPGLERARDLYNGGSIGERVAFVYSVENWDLSEMASHWIDIGRFVHQDDPIEWVMCQTRVRDTRGFGHAMEDHALATWCVSGGGRIVIDAGRALNAPWREMLVGSEGMIGIANESVLYIYDKDGHRLEDYGREKDWETLWLDTMDGLLEWVEGGSVPVTGLPRTAKTAEAVFAAYHSAEQSDRIDFPLDEDFWAIDEWPVEAIARRYSAK